METFSKKFIGKIKLIEIEYLIGFTLSISLWGYFLYQTAIISQDIANDCKRYF